MVGTLNLFRILIGLFLLEFLLFLLFSFLPIPTATTTAAENAYTQVKSSLSSALSSPTPVLSLISFIFINNIRILLAGSLPVIGVVLSVVITYNTAAVLHVIHSPFSPVVTAFTLFGYPYSFLEELSYALALLPTVYFFMVVRKHPTIRFFSSHTLPSKLFPTVGYLFFYFFLCTAFLLLSIPTLFVAAVFESTLIVYPSLAVIVPLWVLVLIYVFLLRIALYRMYLLTRKFYIIQQ